MRWPMAALSPAGQRPGHRLGAGIVKAHAVDQRALGHRAEHARRVIALLRMARHTTQLGEPKAQPRPHRHRFRRLVHARGQPNGIGKTQAETLDRQFRRAIKCPRQARRHPPARGPAQDLENALVGRLGVLEKKQRA